MGFLDMISSGWEWGFESLVFLSKLIKWENSRKLVQDEEKESRREEKGKLTRVGGKKAHWSIFLFMTHSYDFKREI